MMRSAIPSGVMCYGPSFKAPFTTEAHSNFMQRFSYQSIRFWFCGAGNLVVAPVGLRIEDRVIAATRGTAGQTIHEASYRDYQGNSSHHQQSKPTARSRPQEIQDFE
ncbi:hypothetical protein AFLA_012804 [Aspergillus flavus NRRL3357]|nr:hypothetical protein AFLA_012804 [Aspergillus flavus NRRL3357]